MHKTIARSRLHCYTISGIVYIIRNYLLKNVELHIIQWLAVVVFLFPEF